MIFQHFEVIYDTHELLRVVRAVKRLTKDTDSGEVWCGLYDIHPGAFFELEAKGLISCSSVHGARYNYKAT